MNATDIRIAVAFGGPSPEHDVSILTGLQAVRALRRGAAKTDAVTALYWSKTGDWYRVPPELEAEDFLSGVPRQAEEVRLCVGAGGGFSSGGGRLGRARPLPIDVVVVCCHGGPGEDGTLQGVLDLAGLAYTGPDVSGAALGMDKLAFGAMVKMAGLATLPRQALSPTMSDVGFAGPYIVKPRFGGSSIGIDVVADLATAVARLQANPHLRRGAVVEPYRPDLFDLNVAVRCWPDVAVSAVERPLRGQANSDILGYADKYAGGDGMASAPRELPAKIDEAVSAAVRTAAAEVAVRCEVRGIARVDFLSDGTQFWVNEINTIPGSLARYLWIDPPIAFEDLLRTLVAEANARPTGRYTVAGADGLVLRSAGAIAAKLA